MVHNLLLYPETLDTNPNNVYLEDITVFPQEGQEGLPDGTIQRGRTRLRGVLTQTIVEYYPEEILRDESGLCIGFTLAGVKKVVDGIRSDSEKFGSSRRNYGNGGAKRFSGISRASLALLNGIIEEREQALAA